jgi:kumamolisin
MAVRANHVPIPGSARQRPVARRIGVPPPHEMIRVSVLVRRRSAGLAAYVEELRATPAHQRRHLRPAEYVARFGAAPDDIAQVARFAGNNGLHVVSVHPARRTVVLGGTAAQLSAAFGVDLGLYAGQRGIFRARTGPVHIPRWLQPVVVGVFGLDTRPQARPHLRLGRTAGRFRPAAGPPGSFTALQVARLYGFPTSGNGSGQTIGILEFGGGYRPRDLQAYFSGLGLAVPQVVTVPVGAGGNTPTGNPNGPDGEVELDIEVAGAVAPGAKIAVYFAQNTEQGFVDAVSTAVHDQANRPSILSISWGAAEKQWTRQAISALNQAILAASSLGVTVFVAAGDNGSGDGVGDRLAHADFPASSPGAIGCGGTTLRAAGGAITAERVWNDPGDGATGGGVSDVFPVPTFQQAINPVSANPGHHAGRGVPDVSGNADPNTGYQVIVDGTAAVIGGTSAVAPLWAGLTALIQQALGHNVAPFQPQLYAHPAAFRDIVAGNNGAYRARPGWDACTGLGSPRGMSLVQATFRPARGRPRGSARA